MASPKDKMAPDLICKAKYGMAGSQSTEAIEAYSALPLRFGKLLITAPAIVLENDNYDLLIGVKLMREFNFIINHKEK